MKRRFLLTIIALAFLLPSATAVAEGEFGRCTALWISLGRDPLFAVAHCMAFFGPP